MMTRHIELKGSYYGLISVCVGIGIAFLAVLLISKTANPNIFRSLFNLFDRFPLPILAGLTSLFLSAYFFGRKAGRVLLMDYRHGSSIGLTAALKVLVVAAFTASLTFVVQMSVYGGFHFWVATFLLFRVAVPLLLLGLPFAFLLGYGAGNFLLKEVKTNKI